MGKKTDNLEKIGHDSNQKSIETKKSLEEMQKENEKFFHQLVERKEVDLLKETVNKIQSKTLQQIAEYGTRLVSTEIDHERMA